MVGSVGVVICDLMLRVVLIEVRMIVLMVSYWVGFSCLLRNSSLESVLKVGLMFIRVLKVCVGRWVSVIIFRV